jgi:rhomboid protease GluP
VTQAPTGPAPAYPEPAAPRAVSIRLPFGRPRMTYVFLALITLVFLAQLGSENLLGADVVLNLGAKVNRLIAQGQYWRLLTAVFIHASILHFGFNAYALYALGRDVEAFTGPVRFSLVFLLAGLCGSVFSLVLNAAASVGASGAIFGLIGALVVFLYGHRKLFGERGRRNLQSVVVIALINLAIGLQGGIDNWAHLGGLIGGLVLGWAIGPMWAVRQETLLGSQPLVEDQRPLGPVQWALALVFLLALMVIVLAWTWLRSAAG